MPGKLHRALLAAAVIVGAGWSLPVQPGYSLDGPAVPMIIDSPVFTAAAQPGTGLDEVHSIVGSLPVELETDARSLCARHFRAFRNGPVRFLESQTRMRPSALPELERVVALAAACRDARITITGHTDASGNDAGNRALSLQRARAVGDWLAARGVAAERITATGAGSSEPVASNETRYGRSLNRRIDIAFTYED